MELQKIVRPFIAKPIRRCKLFVKMAQVKSGWNCSELMNGHLRSGFPNGLSTTCYLGTKVIV
jgi:hypothetical protein